MCLCARVLVYGRLFQESLALQDYSAKSIDTGSSTDPVLVLMRQPFNVLRYQLSQHYDAHYDVFDPESYGPQSSQRVSPCGMP